MISVCVLVLKFLKKQKIFERDFYRFSVNTTTTEATLVTQIPSVPAHR